jgi:hypothetical protein
LREQLPWSDPDGDRKMLGVRAGVAPHDEAAVDPASATAASALAASRTADTGFEKWRWMVSSVRGSMSGGVRRDGRVTSWDGQPEVRQSSGGLLECQPLRASLRARLVAAPLAD